MRISEPEVQALMRQVARAVRERYGRHPCRDDILAAAYLGMWRALVETDQSRACARSTAAVKGGLYAATDWLRSSENPERQYTRKGESLPQLVSLEGLAVEREAEESEGQGEANFVAGLLDSLAAADLVEGWLAKDVLTPQEWEILLRSFVFGEPAGAAARAMGMADKPFRRARAAAVHKLQALTEE
jgi:hypothetical protein